MKSQWHKSIINVQTWLAISACCLLFGLPETEATFFSYASKDTPNKPCVILNINFTISFDAFDVNKKLIGSEVRSSDDENISVMGSCGQSPQMSLRFENGSSWWFIFRQKKKSVELDQLIQFIPNDLFGDVTPSGNPVSFDDPDTTQVGTTKTSYLCRSSTRVSYNPTAVIPGNITYEVTVTVNGIQVQAFQVKKGKFRTPTECDQDFTTTLEPTTSTEATTTTEPSTTTEPLTTTELPTTTEPTTTTDQNTTSTAESTTTEVITTTTTDVPTNTTTTNEPTNSTIEPFNTTTESTTHDVTTSATTPEPPTTTPSGVPVNNYTVSAGNDTCIVLVASIRIDIDYEAKTGKDDETETRVSEITVPSKFKVSGNCNSSATTQNVEISFFNGWNLEFTFKRGNENDDNADDIAYGISNVTLRYVVDSDHFPNSAEPVGSVHFVVPDKPDPGYPSKSSADAGFYKCDSIVTMTLTDDVDVQTKDLKFKAFNNDKTAQFTGDADECSADDDSSDLVPILVGVVLGALVLIIIIFFLISRWRKKKRDQYETI